MIQYRVKRRRFTAEGIDGWEYAKKTKSSIKWVTDANNASFWKRRSDLTNAFTQGRLQRVDKDVCVIEEVQRVSAL